jgi:hypothetical protein
MLTLPEAAREYLHAAAESLKQVANQYAPLTNAECGTGWCAVHTPPHGAFTLHELELSPARKLLVYVYSTGEVTVSVHVK